MNEVMTITRSPQKGTFLISTDPCLSVMADLGEGMECSTFTQVVSVNRFS